MDDSSTYASGPFVYPHIRVTCQHRNVSTTFLFYDSTTRFIWFIVWTYANGVVRTAIFLHSATPACVCFDKCERLSRSQVHTTLFASTNTPHIILGTVQSHLNCRVDKTGRCFRIPILRFQ